MPGGEKCNKTDDNSTNDLYYSITYVMYCSKFTNLTILGLIEEKNVLRLRMKSKFACPFLKFSALWDFINDHKGVFIVIMVIVGIIECFFGRRLLTITFFLTGFGTGSAFTCVKSLL